MIKLRKATSNDFKFYFELKCEQSSVYWGGFLEVPNIADLKSFWYKYVNQNNSERELLVLENGGYCYVMFKQYLKETLWVYPWESLSRQEVKVLEKQSSD